ncbi:putative solute-binding protein [Labeo rohita]|uniref:Solute-binding protein n=1 Tax=Labeo rohita TaxID=84645 RepID=A0ABQ8LJE8_LABRO|nr:putative solute-binding protein [Labeo rohita]
MEPDELVGVGESRDSQASVGLSQVDVDLLSEGGEAQSADINSDSEESDVGDYFTDVSSQGSSAEKKQNLQMKPPYYTVQQINDFLNDTFNQRRPKLEKYFSDLQPFVDSCALAMRKATLEELDQPKRYRLRKHVSAVKKRLKK